MWRLYVGVTRRTVHAWELTLRTFMQIDLSVKWRDVREWMWTDFCACKLLLQSFLIVRVIIYSNRLHIYTVLYAGTVRAQEVDVIIG